VVETPGRIHLAAATDRLRNHQSDASVDWLRIGSTILACTALAALLITNVYLIDLPGIDVAEADRRTKSNEYCARVLADSQSVDARPAAATFMKEAAAHAPRQRLAAPTSAPSERGSQPRKRSAVGISRWFQVARGSRLFLGERRHA
jgi:hypothetical protein